MADDVVHQIHRQREGILHHDRVDEGQVGARPRSHGAADRIDLFRDLLGAAGGRPLIEQLRHQLGEPAFAFRILRGAGSHEHAHGHGRLLVVSDGDDLHAVGERLHLERRKLDLARRQRPRRPLSGPLGALREGRGDAQQNAQQNDEPTSNSQDTMCARPS